MWELDWALGKAAGGVLDDTFLTFLSGAIAVKKQLNLPLQEVLTFWAPLETRDVVSHLGNEDVVIHSTYSEVFRNAAVAASWSSIFVPVSESTIAGASNASPIAVSTAMPHGYQTGMRVSIAGVVGNTAANGIFVITVTDSMTFTLNGSTGNGAWTSGGVATGLFSGNAILSSSTTPPTPEQNAIAASLGLNAQDVAAIMTFAAAANTLSLDTLAVLLRYRRLAASLSLTIPDLITYIQLTGGTPFNGAPSDTLEFCRRLGVLQASGLAVNDLNYLLRGQVATESAIAFTETQAAAVLQTVGDAVTKAVAASAATLVSVTQTAPIAVSTAQPHGMVKGTKAQVLVCGVQGNTAANGMFSITVTSATSFTLNGSAATLLGPEAAIRYYLTTELTIETIFVAALVTATSMMANVVTPILAKTGILPLNSLRSTCCWRKHCRPDTVSGAHRRLHAGGEGRQPVHRARTDAELSLRRRKRGHLWLARSERAAAGASRATLCYLRRFCAP